MEATQFNLRSPAVKRLMKEAAELKEATEDYYAQPLDNNLFEWHFTVRGATDSDFDGGYYHGRILLPTEYPMKPPSIILLTPNGRFEVNRKICLSISGHHPETWRPSWSIRTALLAIIGFMPTKSRGALGSLDYSPDERKKLALCSRRTSCSICGSLDELVCKMVEKPSSESGNQEEARDLAKQICFKELESSKTETSYSVSAEEASSSDIRRRKMNVFQHSANPSTSGTTTANSNESLRTHRFRVSTLLIVALIIAILSLLARRFFRDTL